MKAKIEAILKRNKRIIYLILLLVFKTSSLFGFIRFPSYNLYIRRVFNTARAGYWSPKLGKVGKHVQIESGGIIRGKSKKVEIDDYSYIDINVQLEIYAPIKIGKYVHIAPNVYIQSGSVGEIIIGDYVAISNGTRIYGASNMYKAPDGREKDILLSMSAAAPSELQCVKTGKVIIEEYAFVGMNCVILPGVTIGRASVIGAGSVVTKDIPPYTIAVGAPARPIKERIVPKNTKM
jgi:acetyltransferase-like isoleucine patch superfamily enzyme